MPAALMYSAMASAALKWMPFVLCAVAFEMKAQRRLVAVLVEVGDVELAAGFDARAGIEIKLQDGAIAHIQQRISRHGIPISCRARVSESARVSSTGSEDSREMNCAWAGLGTVIGSRSSAAAPVRNL